MGTYGESPAEMRGMPFCLLFLFSKPLPLLRNYESIYSKQIIEAIAKKGVVIVDTSNVNLFKNHLVRFKIF